VTFTPVKPDPSARALTTKGDGLFREIKAAARVRIPEVFTGLDHKFFDTQAIWDTGATNTVIDGKLAAQMNLPPTGKTLVMHAQGAGPATTYIIDIVLPMEVGFREVRVTEGHLGDAGLLIGMDIITVGDFALTRNGGASWFSFRIPPSGHPIDYAASIDNERTRQAARQQKPPFWNPPRGSKKKRKRR
jgi:predicted aspartyl protease